MTQIVFVHSMIGLLPGLTGRQHPIFNRYRPNHHFADKFDYSGELYLIGRDLLQPGEFCEALICFPSGESEDFQSRISRNGASWLLNEGGNTVGIAKKIAVVSWSVARSLAPADARWAIASADAD